MITTQKGFRGIDHRKTLSSDLSTALNTVNFRITDSGSLEKRPAVIEKYRLPGNVDGLWSGMFQGRELIAAVSLGRLFTVDSTLDSGEMNYIGNVGGGKCQIFEFNNALYIKSDSYYGKFDGTHLRSVEGYIPIVAIGCTPSGDGEPFEQLNLLTSKRRQLFSGDGQSVLYTLSEENIDSIVSVKVDGVDYDKQFSLENRRDVSFEFPPASGLNNVEITYQKAADPTDRDRIIKCTRVMLFGGNSDGRAFLWGNAELPNYRFHSDLANGIPSVEYFPVNAFTVIGNSKINCIVQQYDRQLIFTKNEAYYSYSELRTDRFGNTVSSFPVFSLNSSKGSITECNGCIIDNSPVTLCDDGFNRWESTSIVNERNAVSFSAPINELIRSTDPETIKFFDFQSKREFFCIIGSKAVVYNYGNGAWYCFDGFGCEHFSVLGGKLYFSNGASIFVFSDSNGMDKTVCTLETPFITNNCDVSNFDVTMCEADIFIGGESRISFTLEKSDGTARTVKFGYPSGTNRFFRIRMRPALKRAMPFRLNIRANGDGALAIHGITIKTRQKERSKKYGIL